MKNKRILAISVLVAFMIALNTVEAAIGIVQIPALLTTKRPASETPVLGEEEVFQKLMSLNRPTAPYKMRDGSAENVDLVGEWKIVDAEWYEVFAKAGLSKTYKIFLKFHPDIHEVRALYHVRFHSLC